MKEILLDIVEQFGSLGVGLLMFLENVFPPLPSEIIMPMAGYFASQGKLSFAGVLVAGSFGSLAGTFLWYLLGRRLEENRMRGWIERHGTWLTMRPEELDRARAFFQRHGGKSVFIGRMVPVVRTLISVPAGFARMPPRSFLAYSLLGTILWTGLMAAAGWILGSRFEVVGNYLSWITWTVIGGGAVWYLFRVVRLKRH